MKINSFTIFVNRECNLDCTYCFVDKIEMNLVWSDKIAELVTQVIEQTDEIVISVLWWEPLLNFAFIQQLILHVEKMRWEYPTKNIEIGTINTNGTIYTKDMYKFFHDHAIELQFSIDSFLYNTYDHYRVHKTIKDYKLYEIIGNNIEKYKAIYWVAPRVSIVVTKENVVYLSDLVKYFVEEIWTKSIAICQLIAKKGFINRKAADIFKLEYIKIFNYYIQNLLRYRVQIDPIEEIIEKYLAESFSKEHLSNCSLWKGLYLWSNGLLYMCTLLAGQWSTQEDHIFWSIEDGLYLTKMEKFSHQIITRFESKKKENFWDEINIEKMFCLREWYDVNEAKFNEKLYEDSIHIPFLLIESLSKHLNKYIIAYFETKYDFVSRFR